MLYIVILGLSESINESDEANNVEGRRWTHLCSSLMLNACDNSMHMMTLDQPCDVLSPAKFLDL